MRILVVDDESDFVSTLVGWLALKGHEAFGITGSTDLASWVVRQKTDVVFLDVFLRDGNGLSLIPKVHAASPATAVILISGKNDPSTAAAALKAGAREFFAKPLDFAVLDQALEKIQARGTP